MKIYSPLAAAIALAWQTSNVFGVSVDFATLLGGSNFDIPTAMATGPDGSIYVTGLTGSSDFSGAIHLGGGDGAFVVKLSPDGSSISYTTLLGGILPRGIAVDASGQVYLAGSGYYNGLPVVNALQPTTASAFDAVLLKLNSTGSDVLFATYLGGAGDDTMLGIALDGNGNIWTTGLTTSEDFPTTANAFQPARASGADAFLTEISGDGATLKYSSYFGGAGGGTLGRGIAIDSSNRPIIVGRTASSQFPIKNALQTTMAGGSDIFVAKFEATGQALVFSTYFGGNGADAGVAIALDAAQNIFIQGVTQSADFPTAHAFQSDYRGERDICLTKLTPTANAVIYSTYLGGSIVNSYRGFPNVFGSGDVILDVGGVAVTPAGRAMVAGMTYSSDFPLLNAIKTRNNSYSTDAVAAMFEPDGTAIFSSYVGGGGSEEVSACVIATADGAFAMAGTTFPGARQPDFPVTPNAPQKSSPNQSGDGFVMKLSAGSSLLPNNSFATAAVITGGRVTLFAQTDAPNAPEKTAWFRWTAPATGHVILSASGNFEATIAAYHGTDASALTLVTPEQYAQNGDLYTDARYAVTAGETLSLAVSGANGSSGSVAVSLILSLPANDDFANRFIIEGATVAGFGSNVGATTERGDRWEHSVWWEWSTPTAGAYTISTVGSDFDTAVALYRAATGPDSEILLVSGSYTNNLGRITFQAEANTRYQIAVLGEYGSTGNIQLEIPPAARPPNDDFAHRTLLNQRNETVSGTDFDAVYDPAEWDLGRLAELPYVSGRLVWWQWTAPIDGAVDISTVGTFRTAYPTDVAVTSLLIFEGDQFPTTKEAIVAAFDPNQRTAASVFLPTIHAGVHYQIGVDAIDWQQPAQITLKIRAIAPPRIIAGSAQFNGAGNFTARVEGIEGHNYRVTSSPNLKDWTTVAEFPAIVGEFSFETPPAPGSKFFRIEEF